MSTGRGGTSRLVDLLVGQALADPYPLLAELREHDPVCWDERYRSWFVFRHDDVSAALRDSRFSSERLAGYREKKLLGADPALRATFEVLEDWMVFRDQPDHGRLRRLLQRAFTPRAVDQMRGRVTELADELIDDIVGRGSADLIGSYAYPLTASVIAEMLGVPRSDRDHFKAWSHQVGALVFGSLEDPSRYSSAAHGMTELTGYLSELINHFGRSPDDNLITALISARDDGDALSAREVLATSVLLLFAGHETTTNLIGNGVLALLRNPAQLSAVRDDATPSPTAIDELVRYDGPAKTIARVMATDVELRGHQLHAGARVFLCTSSANRDPTVFDEPDQLVINREPNPHVGFGFGIHYCLGAPLARMEASVAIPRVLRRLPNLRLGDGQLRWHPVLLSRGLEALPVSFDQTTEDP